MKNTVWLAAQHKQAAPIDSPAAIRYHHHTRTTEVTRTMAEDCLFCKIVSGDIPGEIVYEDELCLAFRDIDPKAPQHALVIPKEHLVNLLDASSEKKALLGHLVYTCAQVARQLGVAESGFRTVANCGADGGQSVDHLHFHVLGGRALSWPPG